MGSAVTRIKSHVASKEMALPGSQHHCSGCPGSYICSCKTPLSRLTFFQRSAQQLHGHTVAKRNIETVQRQAQSAPNGLDVGLLARPALEETGGAPSGWQCRIGLLLRVRKVASHQCGLVAEAAPHLDIHAQLALPGIPQ